MWSSSPYAEPPPFIWISVFVGTSPTLAGTPDTSTGDPPVFAHGGAPPGHGGGAAAARRRPGVDPGVDPCVDPGVDPASTARRAPGTTMAGRSPSRPCPGRCSKAPDPRLGTC